MHIDSLNFRYLTVLILLIACMFFFAGRMIYWYAADSIRFPINIVKIAATYEHISHKQLEVILAPYVNFSFFSLPIKKLYADLAKLDWAHNIHITRVWPDVLQITIIEKLPIATWNNDLLTADGEIVALADKTMANKSLVHLGGPVNQQHEVLQIYKKISKILKTYGLYIIALNKNNNQSWNLTLANGLQLYLGKQDLEKRIIRFCKLYQKNFAAKIANLATVDLRYAHGIAAQWKK